MTTPTLNSKKKPKRTRGANGRPNVARITDIVINGAAHLPPWITDHNSFRRWACSDDFPRRGQFFFLAGELWADLSMETLIHNQIKNTIAAVLTAIAFGESLGRFLADRMMLANIAAGLSCEPDGMFISSAAFADGRITLKNGDDSLEIIGTPDMALEVVSKTSVEKDAVTLKELYAKAGIAEYWLVDSTVEAPALEIYRLAAGRYVAARKHDGWVKSNVFGRAFRLACKKDAQGVSQFNLETK
jgi:Uma2 family endonuclease